MRIIKRTWMNVGLLQEKVDKERNISEKDIEKILGDIRKLLSKYNI